MGLITGWGTKILMRHGTAKTNKQTNKSYLKEEVKQLKFFKKLLHYANLNTICKYKHLTHIFHLKVQRKANCLRL